MSIRDARKWVKGVPAHEVAHDGRRYYFAGDRGRQAFLADPAKYVPVLNGDCVVSYVKMGKRVAGNIRHATYHGGRLFLFANQQAKQLFASGRETYANVDLAFGGICAVCRLDMKQNVPGKPETIFYHSGLRYLFLSDKQRNMFRANPGKYQVRADADRPPATGAGSRQPPPGSDSRQPSEGSDSR